MTKVKKPAIRVRLAPSPTGLFHVGTAQSGVYNWLFAKHHNGQFILRIEDTDKERSQPQFEKDICAGLEWLGLKWDEFHRSSERQGRYRKHLEKLLADGKAFWCYHSKEELAAESAEQMTKKEAPKHVCSHKFEIRSTKSETQHAIIRLNTEKVTDQDISWDDMVRGEIKFGLNTLGDISLAKNLDEALYNFAVVVDDWEMQISHVIRGEDHISNTPKQILIYLALGAVPPRFAHLPLLLGSDRSKLSKRHGSVAFSQYIESGYTPEGMFNFLAMLGWSTPGGEEVFSKNQAIEWFAMASIHKSGAIFNPEKLNWINAHYIKQLNDELLTDAVLPFVEKHFPAYAKALADRSEGRGRLRELVFKMAPLLRERLTYFDQVKEFSYFFVMPEYATSLLIWKKGDSKKALLALEAAQQIIEERAKEKELKLTLDKLAEEQFAGDRGMVYWPLRVALSGEKFSADPLEIINILGGAEALKRIAYAINKLRLQP